MIIGGTLLGIGSGIGRSDNTEIVLVFQGAFRKAPYIDKSNEVSLAAIKLAILQCYRIGLGKPLACNK
jgi:hypothetical protein